MEKIETKTETKGTVEDKVNQRIILSHVWDSRLGEWAEFDDKTDTKLPSYSRLLSQEQTLFIIRDFKLCNSETDGNRYLIKNSVTDNLFYGIEEDGCCNNMCICGGNRAFSLKFYDKNKVPALQLYRPCRVGCCGLIPCCRQVLIPLKVN